MKQDMIVILDLGSSENTALAREIRALGVYSEIYPHDITKEELQKLPNVKGVILFGGEHRNVDGKDIDVLPEIYDAGYPVMAIDQPSVRPSWRRCRQRSSFADSSLTSAKRTPTGI